MTVLRTLITTTVLAERQVPTAALRASTDFGVIGSIIKVDGSLSSDPEGYPLTYSWSFASVPIGSVVGGEGFRVVDSDGSVVSFSPDLVGEYVVSLTVSNGIFESPVAQQVVSIRAVLVPHAQGIVPDGKWIWRYIRDVWQGVENKEMFETLWSALVQIAGAELLKLYQVDFNKSIRDIQDLFQRRWLSYTPRLELQADQLSFFLGSHYAGNNAATINLGTSGSLVILGSTELYVVEGSVLQNVTGETLSILSSRGAANIQSYTVAGVNSAKNGYNLSPATPVPLPVADRIDSGIHFIFDTHSTSWQLVNSSGKDYAAMMMEHGSPLDYLLPFWLQGGTTTLIYAQVGDVVQLKTGPNKGLYRIVARSGSFITVDKAPPSNSTSISPYLADIFRPVRFNISQPESLLTDTISIPYTSSSGLQGLAAGRVLVVDGQSYTIVRSYLDTKQKVPSVIVVVDQPLLQTGLTGLSWRTPHTLVSATQNFEAEGVASGDLLKVDITQGSKTVTVSCQVLGVDGDRIGVVFSDETIETGVVPAVPDHTINELAAGFGLDATATQEYLASINSQKFKNTYWDVELTSTSDISVNPLFHIVPRYIVRNRLIPVDETLRSVPLLQNFILQPELVSKNGKLYQQRNGQLYEVAQPPKLLKENVDFVVDGQTAFSGEMSFFTGTDLIQVDGADFVDKGVSVGDQFVIESPITLARTYYIQEVLNATTIRLTRQVPLYFADAFVTAKVRIVRRREGRFIRVAPSVFTAADPAPDRLWAEVSFFDNNESIEDNFGILVGLTRDDINTVSETLNYRQAVSGIMYAYLQGSSLGKIRVGAQILLGLPFAEHRGIIRSIDPTYRLDRSGTAVFGRLLIEDVDNVGTALGTLRIYTYPIDQVSILAGIETNPTTGVPYVVGDIVERFSALSKGVEISDYVSVPATGLSSARTLQQYHSLRLRVNDGQFTLQELGLVSTFLKRITPSYIAFYLSILSEFADTVTVAETLKAGIKFAEGSIVDNASLSIPPTMMLDSRNPDAIHQIRLDDAVYWVRRVGHDLVTALGSSTVTVAQGGFLTARANEHFEGPLTVAGDVLLLVNGEEPGYYPITAATNTTLTVTGPANGFQAGTNIRYAVLRKLKTILRTSTATMTSGNAVVRFAAGGLRTQGVGIGDYLLNTAGLAGPKRYTIIDVHEFTPGSNVWDCVTVTPTPGVTSTSTFSIARSKIFESPFPDEAVVITSTGTGNTFSVPAGSLTPSLMDIGDELIIQSGTRAGSAFLVLDPQNNYIVPAMIGATETVRLAKKNRTASGFNWGIISQFDPIDVADAAIAERSNRATCTAASKIVTLQMQRTTAPTSGPSAVNPITLHVLPGDILKLAGAGNGAVDLGYGAGLYPIVSVTASDVRLAVNLTASETVAWSIIRRR